MGGFAELDVLGVVEKDFLGILAGYVVGQAESVEAVVVGNLGFKLKFLDAGGGDVPAGQEGFDLGGMVGEDGDLEAGGQLVAAAIGVLEVQGVGGGFCRFEGDGILCGIVFQRVCCLIIKRVEAGLDGRVATGLLRRKVKVISPRSWTETLRTSSNSWTGMPVYSGGRPLHWPGVG